MGGGQRWRNRDSQKGKGVGVRVRGEREKGKSLGLGALRKGLEPHLCSSEQVTRVESLSPELRGQLQALLLQRPQHLIQPIGTRPCQGERPVPGPRTKSPEWEGPRSPLPPSWTKTSLALAHTSTQVSWVRSGANGEGRRMARPEFWEGMFLVGIVPGVLHAVSHLIFTTIL